MTTKNYKTTTKQYESSLQAAQTTTKVLVWEV